MRQGSAPLFGLQGGKCCNRLKLLWILCTTVLCAYPVSGEVEGWGFVFIDPAFQEIPGYPGLCFYAAYLLFWKLLALTQPFFTRARRQ